MYVYILYISLSIYIYRERDRGTERFPQWLLTPMDAQSTHTQSQTQCAPLHVRICGVLPTLPTRHLEMIGLRCGQIVGVLVSGAWPQPCGAHWRVVGREVVCKGCE